MIRSRDTLKRTARVVLAQRMRKRLEKSECHSYVGSAILTSNIHISQSFFLSCFITPIGSVCCWPDRAEFWFYLVQKGMGDHLVLYVDKLITSETFQARREDEESGSASNLTKNEVLNHKEEDSVAVEVKENGNPEDETIPLVKSSGVKYGECRICQEEDEETKMESPCACSGSLKFAHRKCVQRWCNEKGSIICEICHQTYGPGYTAPPQSDESDDSAIDLSESWGVPGAQVNLHDPRLIAMAAAERHFFEPDYDEYAAANASGAAFCRSAALILLALLFLRHALTVTSAEEDADSSTFLSLFLLRAAGFLLPCYIMAWAISILQRRRQRQEESMTASEVAFLLHAGRARSLQYTVSPVASIRHELP